MRTCTYPGCDRRLITGRKYCHVHRSFGKESKGHGNRVLAEIILVILFFVSLIGLGFLLKYFFKNLLTFIVFNGLVILGIIILTASTIYIGRYLYKMYFVNDPIMDKIEKEKKL